MELRCTQEEYEWLVANPMVWFAAFARAAFGRVAPGEPGHIYAEDGETVLWRVWSHSNIDAFDQRILDVILAGKAYAEKLGGEEGQAVIYVRAVADLEAFLAVEEQVSSGLLEADAAVDIFTAEVNRQAKILGLPDYVEPPEEMLDDLLD